MNMTYDHKYDDIINMEHHKSKKHPQMSLYARSAQFAPFAALTGYEDAVWRQKANIGNPADQNRKPDGGRGRIPKYDPAV